MKLVVVVSVLALAAFSLAIECGKENVETDFRTEWFTGRWFKMAYVPIPSQLTGACSNVWFEFITSDPLAFKLHHRQFNETTSKYEEYEDQGRLGNQIMNPPPAYLDDILGETIYKVVDTDYVTYAVVAISKEYVNDPKYNSVWILSRTPYWPNDSNACIEKAKLKIKENRNYVMPEHLGDCGYNGNHSYKPF